MNLFFESSGFGFDNGGELEEEFREVDNLLCDGLCASLVLGLVGFHHFQTTIFW